MLKPEYISKNWNFKRLKLLIAALNGVLLINALPVLVINLVLLIMLTSCRTTETSSTSWQIYHNWRYNFEFPYPNNWIASPAPDNGDGQAFSNPQNPTVNMRGWAEARLPLLESNPQQQRSSSRPAFQPNFKTQQGVEAQLQVQINSDISLMKLTLIQPKVQYHWQGQAPSQQFADFYRFFYYVASQYRIKN